MFIVDPIRITAKMFGSRLADRADQLIPTDSLRRTWSLRVARRVDRVASSRSESLGLFFAMGGGNLSGQPASQPASQPANQPALRET